MSHQHFLVAAQDRSWHYTYKGDMTGPYSSRDEAVAAAIAEAGTIDDGAITVVVQDADMRTETVWSANPSRPA